MPYPRLSFLETPKKASFNESSTTLPVDWPTGAALPPNIKGEWSPELAPEAAKEHLKTLVARVKGPGRLVARWRHGDGNTVQVQVVLFRSRVPPGSTEDPPEWYRPRRDAFDRLRGKDII